MNYGKTNVKNNEVKIDASSILYRGGATLGSMLLINNTDISNCNNAVNPGIQIYHTTASTLNTPFKQGLTQATEGMILSCVYGDYGVQLAFQNGSNALYTRSKGAGSWGSWIIIT